MSNAPARPTRRVVWADDAVLIRSLLSADLAAAGIDVIDVADDYVSAVAAVRRSQPDAAILDVRMPPNFDQEGIQAAVELRRTGYLGGLIVVSSDLDIVSAKTLLEECGPRVGYLLKNHLVSSDELADAIDRVCAGGLALDPSVVERLMNRPRESQVLDSLTKTELEVLSLIAEGRSNRGIAETLVVGDRTVESHVRTVFQKLGLPRTADVHRRVLATICFLRELG